MDYSVFKAQSHQGNAKVSEIAAAVRAGIQCGDLQPGQALAGASAVGKAFNCSGGPVEGARKVLVAEGLVVRRNGRYFIAQSGTAPRQAHDQPHSESGEAAAVVVGEEPTSDAAVAATDKSFDDAFADLLEPGPSGKP